MKFYIFITGNEVPVNTWAAITSDDTIDIGAEISCIPNAMTWHGFAKVNVTDDSKLKLSHT